MHENNIQEGRPFLLFYRSVLRYCAFCNGLLGVMIIMYVGLWGLDIYDNSELNWFR